MKLLIIGGTGFLGRHLTALALDWGHEVTLFNRGRRQHPDWRELTQLQGELLTAAIEGLRPGGIVAYVTCSPHLGETASFVVDLPGCSHFWQSGWLEGEVVREPWRFETEGLHRCA